MYNYNPPLKTFFSKYKFALLALILIVLLTVIFFIIKTHNDNLPNYNLDESSASEQSINDIDCKTLDFLPNFSEDSASLICARLQDFVYEYNSINYDAEYLGFTYVTNSFSGSSFKIKSSSNETFTITISESENDLTLTPNPPLR